MKKIMHDQKNLQDVNCGWELLTNIFSIFFCKKYQVCGRLLNAAKGFKKTAGGSNQILLSINHFIHNIDIKNYQSLQYQIVLPDYNKEIMIRFVKSSIRIFAENNRLLIQVLPETNVIMQAPTANFHKSFSTSKDTKNKSSRQIDIQIHQQKWKQMQNNYKSLKTAFGLKVPKQIRQNYPKPPKIIHNLQALRECSINFPEYLLEELKYKQSKFHQVIQKEMNNLWRAQKKQSLQMMEFIYTWKLHNQQTQELIPRAIQKLDLTMNQMFQVLRWFLKQKDEDDLYLNKEKYKDKLTYSEDSLNPNVKFIDTLTPFQRSLLSTIQNKLIMRINNQINPEQYDGLFKIINLGRYFDLYSEKNKRLNKNTQNTKKQQVEQAKEQLVQEDKNFYDIIQESLLKNIESIPPQSLVVMAVHYANNMKQDQDQRLQILQKMEDRLLSNLKFLSHEELIATAFSYIRTSMLSQKFIKKFTRRVQLLYSQMSFQNKKKVLSIALNLPKDQKVSIIGQSQMEMMKGKPIITKGQDGSLKKQYNPKVYIQIDYQLVPQIYLASYEANLLSNELLIRMQDIILNNVFNYSSQEIVKCVWLFTVTQQFNNSLTNIHKKVQTIIQGGFHGGQFTIKDVATIVWSMCNSGKNNQVIYKPQAKFWNNIQFYLQQKLINCKQNFIHNCSYILWAYTYNRALKAKIIFQITEIILEYGSGANPIQKMNPFQLINITAFYYSVADKIIPSSIARQVKKICINAFEHLYKQMNYTQIIKCLKYLVLDQNEEKINLKIKTWTELIEIFTLQFDQIQYGHIMGIVSFLINCPLGRAKEKKVVKLVEKLLQKKKRMEQLQQSQNAR